MRTRNMQKGRQSILSIMLGCICTMVSSASVWSVEESSATGKKIARAVNSVTPETQKKIEKAQSSLDTSGEHARKVVRGEAPAATEQQRKQAADTASTVNQVPGVKVSAQDLTPPKSDPPIKGFHPIKRALRPIVNMESMVVKLQQQIMKLEGPIAGLNPPMVALQKKMTTVTNKMDSVTNKIGGVTDKIGTVDDRIGNMQKQITSMEDKVNGVRSDLSKMEKAINRLEGPINGLRKPITSVTHPLVEVHRQLDRILFAILVAAFAISIGTPVAAILIYVNRRKLFPYVKEQEMPQVSPGTPASSHR